MRLCTFSSLDNWSSIFRITFRNLSTGFAQRENYQNLQAQASPLDAAVLGQWCTPPSPCSQASLAQRICCSRRRAAWHCSLTLTWHLSRHLTWHLAWHLAWQIFCLLRPIGVGSLASLFFWLFMVSRRKFELDIQGPNLTDLKSKIPCFLFVRKKVKWRLQKFPFSIWGCHG